MIHYLYVFGDGTRIVTLTEMKFNTLKMNLDLHNGLRAMRKIVIVEA